MSKPKAPEIPYIPNPAMRQIAVPIASLVLDPDNERKHDRANIDAIKGLIRKFGIMEPIGVREGLVIRGNGTTIALRELAAEKATALEPLSKMLADPTAPLDWTLVPALDYQHLDESAAAAWRVGHNRSAELGKWDWEKLQTTLRNTDVEWTEIGWEQTELEAILSQAHAEQEPPETTTVAEHEREIGVEHDDSEDEVPALPAEPRTKAGDVVELGPHVLHCCDCMDLLRSLPDNSIDAIVTDPPYGLSPDGRARTWDDIESLRREGKGPTGGFMGNAWDTSVPGLAWARECLRVLKPGGHMIAHSATRTVHRLACAIEDAGFEIRDQIGWLHWQGFPKSHDVSKAIDEAAGAEREIVSREVTRWTSTGRNKTYGKLDYFETDDAGYETREVTAPATEDAKRWNGWGTALKPACEPAVLARKPIGKSTVAANVLRWGTGALNIDACRFVEGDAAWPGPSGVVSMPYPVKGNKIYGELGYREGEMWDGHPGGRFPANIYHCPKPAGAEREAGTEHCGTDAGRGKVSTNIHPTVKPTKLYRWLLRLVTPPGGTVLEPFGGSGTTLVAATKEGFRVIAAEREPKYCDIIRARVEHALLP